jgi:hypothetical protein
MPKGLSREEKKKLFDTWNIFRGHPRNSRHLAFSYKAYPRMLRDRTMPVITETDVHDDSGQLLKEIAAAARTEKPAVTYVLDSSKTLPRLMYYLTQPDIEVHVICMTRRTAAIAYSWSRKGRESEGLIKRDYWKSLITILHDIIGSFALKVMSPSTPWLTISYEEFVHNPGKTMKKINAAFSLSIPETTEDLLVAIRTEPHHNINGNGLRFGKIEAIRPDERWKKELSAKEKIIGYIADAFVSLRRFISL